MKLRKGSWGLLEGKVGIVHPAYDSSTSEFHIVDDEGLTTSTVVVIDESIKPILNWKDVPERRRPEKGLWENNPPSLMIDYSLPVSE